MQVGTAKDQSLYNKPSAAVHAGALVAETLPQYNTIQCLYHLLRILFVVEGETAWYMHAVKIMEPLSADTRLALKLTKLVRTDECIKQQYLFISSC